MSQINPVSSSNSHFISNIQNGKWKIQGEAKATQPLSRPPVRKAQTLNRFLEQKVKIVPAPFKPLQVLPSSSISQQGANKQSEMAQAEIRPVEKKKLRALEIQSISGKKVSNAKESINGFCIIEHLFMR